MIKNGEKGGRFSAPERACIFNMQSLCLLASTFKSKTSAEIQFFI